MSNFPERIKEYGTTIHNFAKAIGPFIISRSEEASEKFAEHKARLATVDIMKEVLIGEAKIYQSAKEELLKRCISSDDVERVRIKRDIREIDESIRTLKIGQKALAYLPGTNSENEASDKDTDNPIILDSWQDRFNKLAKLNNEAWREDLLARVLAKESISPGSISPRTLWLIGTLEEKSFHAFAALLDISVFIASNVMIPNTKVRANNVEIKNSSFGVGLDAGNLVYMLSDVGLIADTTSTQRTLPKDSEFATIYGDERAIVKCTSEMKVGGIMYTTLGHSIASLYDAKPNQEGLVLYNNWLEELGKRNFEIRKLPNI